MTQTQKIIYDHQGHHYHGYVANPPVTQTPQGAVIVVHDWTGQNDFARKKAEQFAELGFIGFALDVYGEGRTGETNDEKMALMAPLMQDRTLLLSRILAAVEAVKGLPNVDPQRIAAIGFCFGGLCVLDLARSGEAIKAVVSFHGLLNAPSENVSKHIKAHVLVLHGHDDPMVPSEQVLAFQQEMTQAQADWQMCIYGQTMHAFTNPLADNPAFGTVYNPLTAERSWIACTNFLQETLKGI
jgi:dienelactone hydrolase